MGQFDSYPDLQSTAIYEDKIAEDAPEAIQYLEKKGAADLIEMLGLNHQPRRTA